MAFSVALVGFLGGVIHHLYRHVQYKEPLNVKLALINGVISAFLSWGFGVSFGPMYGDLTYAICGIIGVLGFQIMTFLESRLAQALLEKIMEHVNRMGGKK